MSKIITTLILLTIILTGCFIKPQLPVNQNQNVNQGANTNQVGEINTSNWKTYRNEEYGFEFTYASNFKIKGKEIDFNFTKISFEERNNKDEGLIITAWNFLYSPINEERFVKSMADKLNGSKFNYHFSSDVVPDKSYKMTHWLWNYKDTFGKNNYSQLLLYSKDYDYGVTILGFTRSSSTEYINNVLYNIQQSFRFFDHDLEVTEPDYSKWSDYNNEFLSFTFKYPDSWNIEDQKYGLMRAPIRINDNSMVINGGVDIRDKTEGRIARYYIPNDIPIDFISIDSNNGVKIFVSENDKDIFDTKFRSYLDFWIKTNTAIYHGSWYINQLSFFQSNSNNSGKYKLFELRKVEEFNKFKYFLKSLKQVGNLTVDMNVYNWLSYENNEYGFSFNYPANWKIDTESKTIGGDNYFIVSVKASENPVIGLFVYELKPTPDYSKYSSANIFNGKPSKIIYVSNAENHFNFLLKDDVVINLAFIHGGDLTWHQISHIEDIFNQIRKSFNFF